MAHYCLHVPVNGDAVRVIRTKLAVHIAKGGEITVKIKSANDKPASKELEDAIQHLFISMIVACDNDQFEGLN